ncbi:MAG: hypothetical protein SCM11_13910 [Bacillota bacterium]|nr:hypothetical protein [Bacillota bacterium]
MATVVINLEKGRPKVESAILKLKLELSTLRRIGVKTVKIIHGYGSSGSGGAIRLATRQLLCDQLKTNVIKAYCPGENFGPFENAGRQIVAIAPALHKDPDWGRQNDGITVVVLS